MKVAFLDRDGVINLETNYLFKKSDFKYAPNSVEGMRGLINLGFKIIIVTNQSGIARGFYSEEDFHDLNTWMVSDLMKKKINIMDVFYCPHHPEAAIAQYRKDCFCRKPQPGMFLLAKEKYNLQMKNCILVGDKETDLLAGMRANVGQLFLVRTGHKIPDSLMKASFQFLTNVVQKLKNDSSSS